ncbi:MAG: malto-oligosyltrehalose synthase [Deltaproteobacteria bacterium RBG_16_47_11]|nr:MAG: malto-oligosyltrehalose synthase [Deltaproteobacteria bacterium RBG_16_47_11]
MLHKLTEYRRIPIATYRVQFNGQFKFSDAKDILSYLHELGISDVYASPYFKAKRGSLHGYDILDHNALNPEIGSEKEYDEFTEELRKHGMGQVLDIVPNHMSITENENIWWMDVLENGPSSPYVDFFDIDWKPVKDELENKVLLPLLGDQYGRVLENQELQLGFEEGAFFIHYYDRKLPVAPLSYLKVLRFRIEELEKNIGNDNLHFQEFLSIITAVSHLPSRTEKNLEKILERRREKEIIKRRLWDLYKKSEEVRSFTDENIRLFNGEKGNPRSFDSLNELLNDQVYRLAYWRVATEEINYRRFFDINELAAIRMENPRVFREAHKLIFRLIREGKVTGLRVDHPDGLYDPAEYFYQLQRSCFIQFCLRAIEVEDSSALEETIGQLYDGEISRSSPSLPRLFLYIVGEKILMKSERMPEDWPIFSTTGYVFLNAVNGIFVNMENAKAFDDIYRRYIKARVEYQDLIYEKKRLIMQTSMPSEINMLGHTLNRISEKNRHTRDFTLNNLTNAIVEAIASFSVYRTYVTRSGVNDRDKRYVEQAISRAKRKNPALSATVFDFLKDVLLLEYPEDFKESDKEEWLDFVMRFQQMTGPIMAKGVEDTAFYVYNRFVSLNEVGGNPERFGTPLDTFHGMNIERSKFWPDAMITTSTHDTKRGEDVRARLNVLSEIPNEWKEHLLRWSRINKREKAVIDGQWVPDRNEEYLLYQTLIGVWPIRPLEEKDHEVFKGRIRDYMLKAVREAKVNTSWISPNLSYEENLLKFMDAILSRSRNNLFLSDLEIFQTKLSYCGMYNSLSQTLLKIVSPGIPDFYQGTEIWDFSLVDPDNRKPVDFPLRRELLAALKKRIEASGGDLKEFAKSLIQEWEDGTPKLYVTFKALNYRKENHSLFRDGAYVSLGTIGNLKEHVCAFARQKEEKAVLVVVPRFLIRLAKDTDEMPLSEQIWAGAWIIIPEEIGGKEFRNIFTDETVKKVRRNGEALLSLSEVFAHFPVAMLEKI